MHSTYMFVHTIPAFKLLPGRPSWTFFSSTTFLGGMFLFFLSLLLAKRVCWTVVTVDDRKLHSDRVKAARDARTSAGPAALGARVFIEEKREREVRVRDSLSFATTVTCRWCSGGICDDGEERWLKSSQKTQQRENPRPLTELILGGPVRLG